MSFDSIAKKLNDEKLPTRTGKPWHGKVVRGILLREKGEGEESTGS